MMGKTATKHQKGKQATGVRMNNLQQGGMSMYVGFGPSLTTTQAINTTLRHSFGRTQDSALWTRRSKVDLVGPDPEEVHLSIPRAAAGLDFLASRQSW